MLAQAPPRSEGKLGFPPGCRIWVSLGLSVEALGLSVLGGNSATVFEIKGWGFGAVASVRDLAYGIQGWAL